MFAATSRGIPTFGDLAWKRPVVGATDPSTTYDAPTPVLSPVGAASFGQTLTAGSNGALSGETPFVGLTLAVGDRVLTTTNHGLANSAGIWIVTSLGGGASKWVLTRATDSDSAVELPTGAATLATQYALVGAVYDYGFLIRESTGVWSLRPNVLDILNVVTSLEVGDGSLDPPMLVNGGIDLGGNGLVLDTDTRIQRTGATILTIDDAASGNLALLEVHADRVETARVNAASFTINGEGTATFGTKSLTWLRLGRLVIFDLVFTVTANGSGANTVTITATGTLPQPNMDLMFMGHRSGVGVQPLGIRAQNASPMTFDHIKILENNTIITGALLVNGASYRFGGSYIAQ